MREAGTKHLRPGTTIVGGRAGEVARVIQRSGPVPGGLFIGWRIALDVVRPEVRRIYRRGLGTRRRQFSGLARVGWRVGWRVDPRVGWRVGHRHHLGRCGGGFLL